MNQKDLTTRIHRLDALARGLAKEATLWKSCNDPLHYLERKTYLKAVRNALPGLEEARVVLAKVVQRIEG